MGRVATAGLLTLCLSACAGGASTGAPESESEALAAQGSEAPEYAGGLVATLPNGAEATPGVYTAGALEQSDLEAAAAAGVRTVVDLRTDPEKSFDERAEAEAHGMSYVSIPVAGAEGLTRENVERLDAALRGEGPFLVHCGSSNRVGALFALRAAWLEAKDAEEALAIGRARGLTGLEPAVRQKLRESEDPSP